MSPTRLIASAFILATALAHGVPAQPPDPYAQHIAQTDPLTPAEQLKRFRLPPGFEIQLVAAEPEVRKPININFDARGRLLVTQSVEYPFPAKKGAKARDRVSALADFGEDGHAGSAIVLVDKLNIPIGVTPAQGGLIVYSIPNLYHCTDANGDDTIDNRKAIYRDFGHRDTHGMVNSLTRWIDGWVYACHGFSNTSTVKGADGKPITMQSGNTFRFREDGSQVEYFTHGQVNPFGIAFDPWGNIFTTDCHTLPAYQLLRGAWYPSFGKPHDGLGFGPTMMKHNHGSTGLAGIVYYAAEHFPPEYRDTLFIGNPITNRVNHDKLARHGSTFRAIEQLDFLVCDDPWFRPVDIQLGPDGALYIADFYNQIIGHYEVPLDHPRRDRERGRIWRIIYRGKDGKAPPPKMPDMTSKELKQLKQLLELIDHPNSTVRRLATNRIVDWHRETQKDFDWDWAFHTSLRNVVGRKRNKYSDEGYAHALWAMYHTGSIPIEFVRRKLQEEKPLVRVHLIKIRVARGAWVEEDYQVVRSLLAHENAFVRRAAADALGRFPAAENVEPLLRLWETTHYEDTHLIHTARMALRDHLLVKGMYEKAAPLLDKQPKYWPRIAEVSLGARTPASGQFVLNYLKRLVLTDRELETYLHHAARYIEKDKLPDVYEQGRGYETAKVSQQRIAVRAIHRAMQERGMALPEEIADWGKQLATKLLASERTLEVRTGIEVAQELRLRSVFDKLVMIAGKNVSTYQGLRPLAIDAMVAIDAAPAVDVLAAIVATGEDSLDVRRKAASSLAAINSKPSHAASLKHLPNVPSSVALALAHGLVRSPDGGRNLLAAVEKGKVPARLLQDRVVLLGLDGQKVANYKQRVAKLTSGLPPADERLRQFIAHRRQEFARFKPDAMKGKMVFKKICAACHRLGGEGNKIGPELDGIGLRGFDRLLEDVLDPSRTVDQAFRSTQIVTKGGRTVIGLKLRTEGQVLILANNEGKEVRVPLAEIDQRQVTKLSPMPANVGEVLPPAEFYHLVKFLLLQRQAPKPSTK